MNSHLKKHIISKVAPIITATGVLQLFKNHFGGIGHILTFHRVIPDNKQGRIHNHQSLEITPEHLKQTIQYFRKRGYEFYSMDEVYETLNKGQSKHKFVAFTFDDGYKDNFEIAYPILKQHRVPFTIYITTNFPDRKAILWWYLLEDMLLKKEEIRFSWNGKSYQFGSQGLAQKESTFDNIRSIIHRNFSIDNHEEMFAAIFGSFEPNPLKYVKSLAMSWEEIQKISEDPLVTIGAHTVNHYPLKQLEKEVMEEEILDSKKRIEKYINRPVEHFAYPFGKPAEVSNREFQTVKSLGFKTAVTTRIGNIFPTHQNHLECLPRISINRVTKDAVLDLQTSGMLPLIYNTGKKVVAG